MKVFWRIFLSFWLAIAILLAIVFSLNEPWLPTSSLHKDAQLHANALTISRLADAYEEGGKNLFLTDYARELGRERNVMLFGANGLLLAQTNRMDVRWSDLAKQTLINHEVEAERLGPRIGIAVPAVSTSGKQYVVVITAIEPLRPRFGRLRFWTKLLAAMIPATLICLVLARYITRPLTQLRLIARQLASGRLGARSPVILTRKTDEIGELARDVDSMAGRIEDLMTTQRRFVNNLAHELGAPLTRMQLALSFFDRELATRPVGGIDQLEREVDKLSQLVQELLFLASLERGVIPSETFVLVSLDSLCQEVVRDNLLEIEEKQCVLLSAFEEVKLRAAPQALRRAIENVFRNAIRHVPRGATIRFSCRADKAAGRAFIEVVDTGPGVPDNLLPVIFQPFVRATPEHSESAGTGLGLAIAAEAVALHGGDVSATNVSPNGLLVKISLPYEV